MKREEWKNKRVLVVGMARSGLAVAELLRKAGAVPVLSDNKTEIDGIKPLIAMGCEARLGEKAELLADSCDAVVISPAVPVNAPVCIRAREKGIPLMGELECSCSFLRGTQIGITGTNGKTTTTMLVGEILKNAGKNVHLVGNIGIPVAQYAWDSTEEDYFVIEVSSFQLETVDTFRPHAGAILNLTPDHLSRHGTMECYGEMKKRLVRRQIADDFLVYNADDVFCREMAAGAPAGTIPFSRTQALKTGAWVDNGKVMLDGRALCGTDEVRIRGPHNLENALAAAALTGALGIAPAVIRHTLRHFEAAEHRMEFVRKFSGITYINDSKGTNPDSTIRAVEGMTEPTVLIAGGEDKKTPFEPLAKAILENPNIVSVVLIGKTADKIAASLAEAGYKNLQMAGWDLPNAIRLSRESLPQGGTVLFSPACSSFDMFKDYEERGRIFKELVNQLT